MFKVGDKVETKPLSNESSWRGMIKRQSPVTGMWEVENGGISQYYFDFELVLIATSSPAKSTPCQCDNRDLMRYGCKCGAFKAEKASA